MCLCGQVMIEEDGVLAHPTRDRAKIPHGRRLPTRGHLLAAVAPLPSVAPRWTRLSLSSSSPTFSAGLQLLPWHADP